MSNYAIVLLLIASLVACNNVSTSKSDDPNINIDSYWKEGKTLPESVAKDFPLLVQQLEIDKGYNVLVDLAHQCKFATMWSLPQRLNGLGYRAIGSQASLHSVLDSSGKCRVRIPWKTKEKIFPFSWHPNFSYNVIITNQSDLNAQEYLPQEQEALEKFVNDGGGLIICGVAPQNHSLAKDWSLNKLCKRFDASLLCDIDSCGGQPYAVIEHGGDWKVIENGKKGLPVAVSRTFGKGFVAIYGHGEILQAKKQNAQEWERKNHLLAEGLNIVEKGKQPIGGEPRYPISGGGGGGIYPELEKHYNDIVLFYAANQKTELLNTINKEILEAKELIEKWLPSKPTLEPMYLILSSGGGGGWAVNAFKPKENGIISLSPRGILSIFAHELAHTMHGPTNENGQVAGITPIPNRGEAHAGWFQGKIDAWFDAKLRNEPVKRCNSLFDFDPTGDKLDLVTHYENNELRKEYGKGKDWVKTWWIWQKLDDHYGTTWYPRWKYVQHTRWKSTPNHKLSWDEMVEDMSIAVGEDLFPFLTKAGLSLGKNRLEEIPFDGEVLSLKVSTIKVSEAGAVKLDDIGDYKQKIAGR